MYNRHRVVAVVPGGRQRYLEVLIPYLNANRHVLDVCHLWCNTTDRDDVAFLHSTAAQDPFYQVVASTIQVNGCRSIFHFFKECTDQNTLYIRFDDDICWVAPDAVETLLRFRLENPHYFLIHANCINNSICSYIHQRMGCLGADEEICEYDVFGAVSHRAASFAQLAHESFLNRLEQQQLEAYHFSRWIAFRYERVTINCICWFGADFAKFGGEVGIEEEEWLTQDRPQQLGTPNAICGRSLVSHFAYHTQRQYLEANTDLLARYSAIAKAAQ